MVPVGSHRFSMVLVHDKRGTIMVLAVNSHCVEAFRHYKSDHMTL